MEKEPWLVQVLPTNGAYTLIISLSREIRLDVGKLGQMKFQQGYYAYTGSALGKGSSSLKQRISRHLQKSKRNFWHIDFLLDNEDAAITAVVAAQTNKKLECKLNSYIKKEGEAKIIVKGFGASDCKENCESHILFFPDIIKNDVLVQKIVKYYREKLPTRARVFSIGSGRIKTALKYGANKPEKLGNPSIAGPTIKSIPERVNDGY